MAYNHGRAEKEWLDEWNDLEEKMRKGGKTEEEIAALKDYLRSQFNSDRQNYEHNIAFSDFVADFENGENITDVSEVLGNTGYRDPIPEIKNFSDIIEAIQNPYLYRYLKSLPVPNRLIVFGKVNEFPSKEIARVLGLSEKAVNERFRRIKKNCAKIRNQHPF